MSFLHPEFLYYMLPPLFVLFFLLLTQRNSQESFFSDEVMKKLRVSSKRLTLKARNALFLLMGILMIFALAGPVIDEGTVEIKAKSADIMIALDISDSMLGEDVYPNRLKLAKQKALELLKLAPNERVGVIAFARNSYLVSPLSFDHSAVEFLLRQLNTDSITEKGTNLFSMLEVVKNSVKKESKKYLLVLSDGGDESDFSKEISYAKKNDIAIFVLGVGTLKGAPIKMSNGEFIKENGEIMISKLNENIKELATATGGVYIESVNSNDDVKVMLQEIEAHSEKKELKSQKIKRYIPLFYYPLGLALFIFLVATSSMSKREKVELPLAFLIVAFMGNSADLNAGLLDFMELDKAKKAYENSHYEESQKIYDSYQKKTLKSDVNYNIANALYKQGKYKEAISSYNKAVFDDKNSRARNFSNLGNAYVKSGDDDALKKAMSAYEASLKLVEDKETRENLEAVKKYLKEQKKQEKNKQNNKNNDKKKDQENKEKEQNQNSDKQKDKSDKEQEKSKKQDKEGENSQKDENSQEKNEQEKSKESDKKEEQKNSQDQKQEEHKEEDKAEELKDNNTTASAQKQVAQQEAKMSDEEQMKWLKQLNKNQNTYLYRLNNNKSIKDMSNEKPW